jgi:hypothetical protein
MCWSGQASLGMTAIGISGAIYAKKKGQPPAIWASLAFFTGMEAIQAATYAVIGDCSSPMNTTLTYAGYTHIAIQNIFVQWVALSFIGKEARKRWFKPAMIASGLTAAYYLAMAFAPPLLNTLCTDAWFCAPQTCSVHGNWHIAWQIRLSWLYDWGGHLYFFTAFLLPIFYGSWRWSLFHIVVGPIAARLTTDNRFEIGAVWCLFSIGFLIALEIKPIRLWLNTPRLKADGLDPSHSANKNPNISEDIRTLDANKVA